MPKASSGSVRIFYPKFSKTELLERLQSKIRVLARELPLYLVVLMGSYARGDYTVGSDVDLLVVYKGKKRKDAFKTVKEKVDVPLLEPHVYSKTEYKRMKKLISRMTKNGIILFQEQART
ncbi:MAG: nucleotidyltransferase domain-containing protein [Deltaproteobacteria bacterium]|nr:nucleotidyltransferase domain-containing protein [Deltaproteobacteria bacterium]